MKGQKDMIFVNIINFKEKNVLKNPCKAPQENIIKRTNQ